MLLIYVLTINEILLNAIPGCIILYASLNLERKKEEFNELISTGVLIQLYKAQKKMQHLRSIISRKRGTE